jgi:hypothetical protein
MVDWRQAIVCQMVDFNFGFRKTPTGANSQYAIYNLQ